MNGAVEGCKEQTSHGLKEQASVLRRSQVVRAYSPRPEPPVLRVGRLSKDVEQYLKELQKEFMLEDTKAGLIQAYLENFTGNQVCSKQLYKEALNHAFDEPKQWEIREINEIMNNSVVKGWKQFSNPRYFGSYGRQRGWERDNQSIATGTDSLDVLLN